MSIVRGKKGAMVATGKRIKDLARGGGGGWGMEGGGGQTKEKRK